MLTCAFCRLEVDEDSLYCDQCGREMLVCPKCGKLGRGKMCTADGTALAPRKVTAPATPAQAAPAPDASPAASGKGPLGGTGVSRSALRLINKTLNLDLRLEKDAVIGRTKGDFAGILNAHDRVSSEHARIHFDGRQGWLVTDLGSTNGTRFNDIPLKPGQPQALLNRGYLRIANLEFYVEIEGLSPGSSSATKKM